METVSRTGAPPQHEHDDALSSARDDQRGEANSCLIAGAGLGAWSVISVAALGGVCPLCVIVAPALLGYGAYQRYQLRKREG